MFISNHIPLICYIIPSLYKAFSEGYRAHQNMSENWLVVFISQKTNTYTISFEGNSSSFKGTSTLMRKQKTTIELVIRAFDLGFNWWKEERVNSASKISKVSFNPRDNWNNSYSKLNEGYASLRSSPNRFYENVLCCFG